MPKKLSRETGPTFSGCPNPLSPGVPFMQTMSKSSTSSVTTLRVRAFDDNLHTTTQVWVTTLD